MSELNLILLGAPGAGKGTQAALLTEDFGLPHIATGDILRAAREAGSELGLTTKQYMDKGDLVPDEVVVGVILERLADDDARDGFLLDGFPRTIEQAGALGRQLDSHDRRLTAVLALDAPDAATRMAQLITLTERLTTLIAEQVKAFERLRVVLCY